MVMPLNRDSLKRVDEYHLLGFLGAGGFGEVYVARPDSRPRELVAVKVLRSDHSHDQQFLNRFRKEIRVMAGVSSPYVPRLIRHGEYQGRLWYASELITGPTLHTVVHRCGPLPVNTVRHLGLGIVSALEAIHRAHTAHRDLKPGNVLLVPEGPRVIDFGLAHLVGQDHGASSLQPMGALGYAAPEQLRELGAAGKEADVYALGATLLFAATGHAAYTNPAEGLRGPADLTQLPQALFGIISNCLNQAAAARPTLSVLRNALASPASARGPRAFGAVLQAEAADVIREWRAELDSVIAGGGPVRQEPRVDYNHGPAQTKRIPQTPTQVLDERVRLNPTLIYPGAAPPPIVTHRARNVRWQQVFGDWVRAPVSVAHRAVVAGSLDGTVACLDAESGEVITSLSLGAAVRWVAILPGGERACAADADGGVHLIDLRTGHLSTLFHAPRGIAGTPAQADGHLYTVSGGGLVYEIDIYSGGSRPLYDMREPARGAQAAAYGLVFAAGARGISAIDVASGKLRWLVPRAAPVYSAPVAAGGRLYFAGADGILCSVSADSGEGLEQVPIGVPVHKAIACDPALDLIYVAGADGQVRAYDISGRHAVRPALAWRRGVGEEIGGVIAADGIVHCTADGTVTGLDSRNDGKPRYQVPVGGTLAAAPTLYAESVYVGSLDGAVSRLMMN
jgi:outer membrane protein assembly factor BamB